ncbi:MAG: sigma-70 family RNA polymerase sigma factor [Firmicutes bacterium]|nr:sigma-70 family RNA polymerase sigma factor [Bacillota bacterium]
MQQDALLLRRAQNGEAEAFEELMTAYEKRIYTLCLRMAGEKEDALDCAQEAMVRIWRSLASYRKQASFSTWVYRIATNTCLDFLRKRKVRPAVSLDALTDEGFSASDPSSDPVRLAEASARKSALLNGIASLQPDMRAALVLRDVQGFSYEEVSAILDTPLGTVKSRINRAREKLRSNLFQNAELFDVVNVYGNERRQDL